MSDREHKELLPDEIYQLFLDEYVNIEEPYKLADFLLKKEPDGARKGWVEIEHEGRLEHLEARGNGRLDAISNALQARFNLKYKDVTYSEHALETGQDARAIAYIGLTDADGKKHFGAGMDTDIINASVRALISAINRMSTDR